MDNSIKITIGVIIILVLVVIKVVYDDETGIFRGDMEKYKILS